MTVQSVICVTCCQVRAWCEFNLAIFVMGEENGRNGWSSLGSGMLQKHLIQLIDLVSAGGGYYKL